MAEEFTKGSSLFVSLHACKYGSSEERAVKRKTIRSEQDRKKAGRKKRNIGKVWSIKFSVYACSCQAVFGLHFSSLFSLEQYFSICFDVTSSRWIS